MDDGATILVDEIRARDGDGLNLYDDGGNGLSIADGGAAAFSHELIINAATHIHYTAVETDNHALEIEVNAAGFGDVKALEIDYSTGGIGG